MRVASARFGAIGVLCVAALAGVVPAHALSGGYKGSLASGVAANGSVGGFSWGDEDAAKSDFWRFTGAAGDTVTLSVLRSVEVLDPAFSLYFGTTTADDAEFLNDADWGGMTYLDFGDDEIDHPGPGGDAQLAQFVLPFSGDYTVAIGGFQSLTDGPHAYSLDFSLQPVPEPASVLLMLAGIGLIAGLRHSSRQEV